ncbi:MAG TPA: nucleotide exchange factor GrpE [Thermoanaerobaculia bacterium]
MADENRLDDPTGAVADELDDGPIELDSDDQEDLEETMRQALEAVEGVERGASDTSADVERLEREIADLRDRSIRTLADFDNYRKRAERERQDMRRYALLEPMRELVEVVDNLERAAAAAGSADDLKQGVDMILRQLGDFLRRHGVVAIEAEGQPFDPAFHEAVSRQESDGIDEPVVAQELQKGYRLHERLLRPARVVVAVPAEED